MPADLLAAVRRVAPRADPRPRARRRGGDAGAAPYDLVVISSALSLAQHVTLFDELGEDPVGGALGDAHRSGDVAQADARVTRDAGEDMGVVGQEVPAGRRADFCDCLLEVVFMNRWYIVSHQPR